ncbi:hypothetical protein ABZ897_16075 [Nonomuraea sp. NPDC046802]|uniref:hypothetical protein n=1 Tax=Nonomuraea sp. NPDC046802 TaxID=3154919 RepID=UPI0033DC5DAA
MRTIRRLIADLISPPRCDDAPTPPSTYCRTCDAPAVRYAPGFGWVCANTGH